MAQLGARFHGMEEVIGSIPIRSTNFRSTLNRSSGSPVAPGSSVCAAGFYFALKGPFGAMASGRAASNVIPVPVRLGLTK